MATETLIAEQARLVQQRANQAAQAEAARAVLNPAAPTSALPPPESDPRVVRQKLESEAAMHGRRNR